jgi:hypothetical protein
MCKTINHGLHMVYTFRFFKDYLIDNQILDFFLGLHQIVQNYY